MSDDPPRRLYVAAERVGTLPCVTRSEVSQSPEYERAIVSVVLNAEIETAPPRVLRRLINHDLGVRDVSPQGEHLIVRAY